MGALSMAIPPKAQGQRWRLLLSYNLGRVMSYTLMGVIAGALAGTLTSGSLVLRLVAGLLLIAMGLYLADWWRGLTWLERGGRYIWRYIQPFGKKLMPVTRAPQALLLGALWGWLPCGLVYTALAYALSQGGPLPSGGVMFAFGLGTLPAVMAAGVAAERLTRLLRRRLLRQAMALLIIIFGVWTLLPALGIGHGEHGSSSSTEQAPTPHHH